MDRQMSIETAAAASAAGTAAAKGAGGAALGGAVVGGLTLSALVVMLLKQPRTSREWAVAGNDASLSSTEQRWGRFGGCIHS